MIMVTKLSGDKFFINDEHIESVHMMPDTIIHMDTGNKIVVKETPEELVQRVIEFRREIYKGLTMLDVFRVE